MHSYLPNDLRNLRLILLFQAHEFLVVSRPIRSFDSSNEEDCEELRDIFSNLIVGLQHLLPYLDNLFCIIMLRYSIEIDSTFEREQVGVTTAIAFVSKEGFVDSFQALLLAQPARWTLEPLQVVHAVGWIDVPCDNFVSTFLGVPLKWRRAVSTY